MVSVCVWTQVSRIASRFFTIWTTREAHCGSYPVLTHNYNRCQRLKNILSLPSFLFDFVNSKLRFAWSSRLFRGIWRKPTFNTPNDQTHQWLSCHVYQQSLFQALFTKVPESISNWLGSAPTETGNWSGLDSSSAASYDHSTWSANSISCSHLHGRQCFLVLSFYHLQHTICWKKNWLSHRVSLILASSHKYFSHTLLTVLISKIYKYKGTHSWVLDRIQCCDVLSHLSTDTPKPIPFRRRDSFILVQILSALKYIKIDCKNHNSLIQSVYSINTVYIAERSYVQPWVYSGEENWCSVSMMEISLILSGHEANICKIIAYMAIVWNSMREIKKAAKVHARRT